MNLKRTFRISEEVEGVKKTSLDDNIDSFDSNLVKGAFFYLPEGPVLGGDTFLIDSSSEFTLLILGDFPKKRERARKDLKKYYSKFEKLVSELSLENNNRLIEIPVTTMPIFKIPIHVSYILYLSSFSTTLALLYFRVALLLCRLTKTQLSLLLHPLDFLGGEDVPELAFFPAMNLTSQRKLKVVRKVLNLMSQQFQIVTMEKHAQIATQQLVS